MVGVARLELAGLSVPNRALYQTELHPDCDNSSTDARIVQYWFRLLRITHWRRPGNRRPSMAVKTIVMLGEPISLKLRLATIVFALLASLPVFASEEVTVTTLPSGLRVIVREGHAVNIAAVDIWIRAGSADETADTNGVAHFVEHMIFKATSKYGPGEIDREIEGVGAEVNGGTSKDWSHFYTSVASEYLPTAVNVLADAISNARFRPEDIEIERKVILDELARAEGNQSQRALDLFAKAAFPSSPCRFPAAGDRDVISRMTRDEVFAHYQRYFTPENTCVVIAGDVSSSAAVALVEKAFAGFTRISTAKRAAPPDEPPITSPVVVKHPSPGKDAYLVLGYRVPGVSHFGEVCALDVMLALMGDEHEGRILRALNEKNIRFSTISTDFVTQRYPGAFSVLVEVEPKDADAARDALLSEYRRLADELVPDGELDRAKRLVEGGDLFDQETFAGQARALGMYDAIASYDLDLKYGDVVRGLTAADVMDVARKYFGETNYILIRMQPEGT